MPQQQTGDAIWDVPFGTEGETTLYVGGEIVRGFSIEGEIRLNELDSFELKVFITSDNLRTLIQEGKDIKIFDGPDNLIFKGRLTKVNYKSNFVAECEGFGMAIKLLNRKTNRTEYSNTAADQIVTSEVPSSQMAHGTIESAPVISVRFDHDNDARAVAGAANAVDYDWYVSQKESDDFDKEYLNFVERQGSATSVKTFDIGGAARLVDRQKDTEHIANDITALGYGDGVNQIEARVHAATTKRTVTTEKLDSGTTPNNFSLNDASQLGSDGDTVKVRIGTEVVKGDLDTTSDEINISSRALDDAQGNSTEDIDHYDNIQVWLQENETTNEGPYKPTKNGAEDGSSIDSFGVREERFTDRTVIKKPTLEKIADNELKNRRQDIFRIGVMSSENFILDEVDLGDEVTVKDVTAMDVDDKFRVVGIDFKRGFEGEKTVLRCANRPLRLTERLSDIKRDTDTLNAHMQGSTNIDSQNFGDNADNSNPLKAQIRIPADAVEINKAEVLFSRESYRGYVKNSDHKHDVDITHPEHSHEVTHPSHSHGVTVAEHLNPGNAWFNSGNTQDTSANTFSINVEVIGPPSGTFDGVQAAIQIFNKSGSNDDYDWKLEDSNGNTIASASNKTINDDTFFTWNKELTTSDVDDGETLTLKVTDGVVGTDSSKALEGGVSLVLASKSDETSTTKLGNDETSTKSLGTTSTETSKGSGSPSYGLFTPSSEPDVDVDVIVDGNTVKTVSDVSVGDKISPIDVFSEMSDPIAGEYHEIQLKPVDTGGGNGGRCRLNATLFTKVFIESTV